MKFWACIAAILLFCAVALGAFAAHALQGQLDARAQEIFRTANFYHFIHAIALLLLVALPEELLPYAQRTLIAGLLLAGIFIFSGSLYALAVSGERILGAITPFGGLCFLCAWAILAWRVGN